MRSSSTSSGSARSLFDLGLVPAALVQPRLPVGIIIGWWYLLKLIRQPGAPMARRHADDMVFYATLGIILGGRLGYVLFYKPLDYFAQSGRDLPPLGRRHELPRRRDRGQPRHPLSRAGASKLDWLRIHDYVACCIPLGLFFGRLANFVNGELWGGADRPCPGASSSRPAVADRRATRASSTRRCSRACC